MDEQKTKVDTGSGSRLGDPTVYSGQPAANYQGSWDQTQTTGSEQPTPRPGQVPFPGFGVGAQAGWGPTPGGTAKTEIMPAGPRPEPSFAWLVLVGGPANNPFIGKVYEIKKAGVTTVGRVTGNDVMIPDAACSAQHAKIRLEAGEDGRETYMIYDLASTNGTFAGPKETYKDEGSRVYRHALQDGDYILIGETTLVFKRI